MERKDLLDSFRESFDAYEIWRSDADKMYAGIEGDPSIHYGSAEVVNKLRREKRPTNVYNIMLAKHELLSGIVGSNALDIAGFARGSTDNVVNEIVNASLKYIFDINLAEIEFASWFDDCSITGKGWLEVMHDYEYASDPIFGDISVKSLMPLMIYEDPHSARYDAQDSQYIIKASWIAKAAAKEKYNEDVNIGQYIADERRAGTPDKVINQLADSSNKAVRVVEMYHKVNTTVYYAVVDGVPSRFTSIEDANLFISVSNSRQAYVVSRPAKTVRIATLVGNRFSVDDLNYHHGHYPFIPLRARKFRDKEFGMLEPILDPQIELNKRASQALVSLNSSASGGWKIPKSSVSDEDRTRLSAPGSTNVTFEYDPAIGVPEKIQPNTLDVAHVEMSRIGQRMMDFISGLQPEVAGQVADVAVSGVAGKAVEARQSGSLVSVSRFTRNLTASKKLLGNMLIKMISQFHRPEKLMRVVGRIPTDADLDALRSIMQADMNFNVVVDLAPRSSTARKAQFITTLQLMQVGVPVPPDILVELSDVPNKERIIEALKAQGLGQGRPDIQSIINTSAGSQQAGGI